MTTRRADVHRALERAKEIGAPVSLYYCHSNGRGLIWVLEVVGSERVLDTATAYEVITALNAAALHWASYDEHRGHAFEERLDESGSTVGDPYCQRCNLPRGNARHR